MGFLRITNLRFFVFITIVSIPSFAQFGVKAGMNFAKMSTAPEFYLNNFQGGVFLDKSVFALFDFRIGLSYSPKGYKDEVILLGASSYVNTLQLNYM